MRRYLFGILALVFAQTLYAADQDWPFYGADQGGKTYSPLAQINTHNVTHLKKAWTYHTGDYYRGEKGHTKTAFEVTPIMVNQSLYFCTPYNRVDSLNPETGALRWQYLPKDIDLGNGMEGALKCRGVAYWQEAHPQKKQACQKRIFEGVMDGRLLALDADTGKPCADFGKQGIVDTTKTLGDAKGRKPLDFISPPVVYHNLVIIGSSIGDNSFADSTDGLVRAFDAHDGHLVWTFNPIPKKLRKKTGAANTWAPMSLDEKRGLLFIATSSPSPDYYGGWRTDPIPYANALVALNAKTGKPIWHYQIVHHDIFDYDLPAQPVLFDLHKDGKTIPAVAQGTKMSTIFMFNRVTGKPLFPIKEIPVPQSDVPGEKTSPTQPMPVLPKPLSHLHRTAKDAWGLAVVDKWLCAREIKKLRNEGVFTPPSFQGSVETPSFAGGINWGGLSFDPNTQTIIANTMDLMASVHLVPNKKLDYSSKEAFDKSLAAIRAQHPNDEFEPTGDPGAPYSMRRRILLSIFGAPCSKPPWGNLAAIDAVTGKLKWQVPFGNVQKGIFKTFTAWGSPNIGGSMVTKGGLIFIGAALSNEFHAYDLKTGKELWHTDLVAPQTATPMTYSLHGKQYVVTVAGGHGVFGTKLSDAIVAFALPDNERKKEMKS